MTTEKLKKQNRYWFIFHHASSFYRFGKWQLKSWKNEKWQLKMIKQNKYWKVKKKKNTQLEFLSLDEIFSRIHPSSMETFSTPVTSSPVFLIIVFVLAHHDPRRFIMLHRSTDFAPTTVWLSKRYHLSRRLLARLLLFPTMHQLIITCQILLWFYFVDSNVVLQVSLSEVLVERTLNQRLTVGSVVPRLAMLDEARRTTAHRRRLQIISVSKPSTRVGIRHTWGVSPVPTQYPNVRVFFSHPYHRHITVYRRHRLYHRSVVSHRLQETFLMWALP